MNAPDRKTKHIDYHEPLSWESFVCVFPKTKLLWTVYLCYKEYNYCVWKNIFIWNFSLSSNELLTYCMLYFLSNFLSFDIIIMEKNSSIFTSSELQFGFKAKHSTSQCSFVVEEVIDFYNRNDSPVYFVTLDASQAFHHVDYNKLFQLLIDRNICPLYACLLFNMYTRLKVSLEW